MYANATAFGVRWRPELRSSSPPCESMASPGLHVRKVSAQRVGSSQPFTPSSVLAVGAVAVVLYAGALDILGGA